MKVAPFTLRAGPSRQPAVPVLAHRWPPLAHKHVKKLAKTVAEHLKERDPRLKKNPPPLQALVQEVKPRDPVMKKNLT